MLNKIIRNILIAGVFLGASCVEKYDPEITKYENILVVDGMITAEPGPYTVKLSSSAKTYKAEFIPFPNAEIIIFDDLGNSEMLTESNPGEYKTADDGIQGVVGRKYKIQIKSPDDKIYSSDYEEIKTAVGIDSVYSNIKYQTSVLHPYDLVGLEFFVDTKVSEVDTNFYMWRLESTFEYNSSYLISYMFNGHLNAIEDRDTLYTCWKTEKLTKFFLSNTENLSEPKVNAFPLNYVTTEDRDLSIKYSLLVKQLTLTENAYKYWQSLDEINSEQGNLFSTLPYQVRGNIYCETNENEAVLGYFMAAGISEKRIFVDRPELAFHYWQCYLTRADYERYGYIHWSSRLSWPLYVVLSQAGRKALPHQDCVDCTRKGGVINKPEFWTE